ncbi:MAG: MFS transporter [Candidatus Helarchaeota archaeon]
MSEDKKEGINKNEVKISGLTASQIVINTTNIIDNADSQLLPSVYPQVQKTMGLDIIQLGWITGIRSFLQAASTPLWGWWSDRHSRKKVLAVACFIWSIFTLLIAFSYSYIDMLIYRSIIGVGLAAIVPTAQSLLSDYFRPEKRGKAFGLLGLTGVFGIIFGTIYATALVGSVDYIFGLDSWRFVFITFGIISIVIGFAILIFTKDISRGITEPELKDIVGKEVEGKYKMKLVDFKKILTNKTFILIVAQGVAGSIPWQGILFMVTWFEYIGFDPLTAGLIFIMIAIGAAFGNFMGGLIGDWAAKKSPKRGRIIIAQISVFLGIPMTLVIFYLIPMNTSSMVEYIIVGGITGLLISWCGPGCNSPIFSEIFEPEIRSSVFSVDRMFEGSAASLGTIFVGVAATFFGFITPPIGTEISSLPPAIRYTNMMALANGMFFVALIPWILCLVLYTFVYFTYPKDYEKMRQILKARAQE